jgi:pimeloyl-ACP methyl ester carboxylesterase
MRKRLVTWPAGLLLLAAVSTQAWAATNVVGEKFVIPALDPGIELQVLNRHPASLRNFAPERVVLFVHGATFPVAAAFDMDLPGGSWMANLAQRGFDVYAVDVRGYGGSTRPAAMDQDPAAQPPFAVTRDAVRDVSAAVEFILKRRGIDRLNIIGWSWGTTTMATYAAENPAKVVKVVLFAPVWLTERRPQYQGGYRTGTRESVRAQTTAGLPKDRVEEISPGAWYDKWWSVLQSTDPGGAQRTPPVIRAPNGVFKDLSEYWGSGKPFYDPAAIRAPTLLVVGEWDATTPPAGAQALFEHLTGSKDRRLLILAEGSHQMALEKNRLHLIRAVQGFLEEPLD